MRCGMCQTARTSDTLFVASEQLASAMMIRAASPLVDVEAEYWLAVEQALYDVQALGSAYPSNLLSFADAFEAIYAGLHRQAAFTGRILAGGAGSSVVDRAIAATAILDDRVFLARFLQDILNGRYGDAQNWKSDQVRYRMSLYISKARSSGARGFVAASPVTSLYYWTLTGIESCADCPRLAGGSPYTSSQLPYMPSEGRTQCRTNCLCVLIRQDGASSPFPPPPTVTP
jgi:hypothetical protein